MSSANRFTRALAMTTVGATLALGMTANAASASSAASSVEASAKPTPGFKACYDLNCNKRIAQGKAFNANGDHGITRVKITRVNRNGITVRVSGPNMSGECAGSPHVNCTINGLDITSWSRRGDTAMFGFWP